MAPKIFKPVITAGFLLKDMGDDVAKIDEYPSALVQTLDIQGPLPHLLQHLFHRLGNGGHLTGVGARTDEEGVGLRGESSKIETDGIGGLFRLGCFEKYLKTPFQSFDLKTLLARLPRSGLFAVEKTAANYKKFDRRWQ